jgi:hypothetical protein
MWEIWVKTRKGEAVLDEYTSLEEAEKVAANFLNRLWLRVPHVSIRTPEGEWLKQ